MKISTYHKITIEMLLLITSNANSRTISGIIYDAITKESIANVSIMESFSGQNTISNEIGYFSIVTPNDNVTLIISHISYELKTIALNQEVSDTSIVIELSSNPYEIENVNIVSQPIQIITNQSYSHICMDERVIEEKIATSLIDVLEEVPGITKRGEYFSPITLRGLGGKRILITKDGNRRMGNFSSGFMGQGINIYDLKKIEVIKGPASVIYGPGAISGIINMETKSPFSKPGISGRILSSYGANNHEKNILSSINWATLDQAVSFSCRYRKADDYTYGDGTTAENSSHLDKDIRLSYSREGSDALRIIAESELHLGGPWGRPVGFNGTNYMKLINKEDDTWHTSLSALWQPEKKHKKTECSIYFDLENRNQVKDSYDVGTNRLSYREDISYKNYYLGWRELSVFDLYREMELKIGTDGVLYRIESPTLYTDYFLSTTINNRVSKNAGVAMSGLFGETRYKTPNNRINLRAGLRLDYSKITEGAVHDTTLADGRNSHIWSWNGTSSIVYKIEDVNLSFQLARSCRIPDSKEMFIVTSGTDGMIYGNPDLTPEYGLNIDAGVRGNTDFCTFDLSLFMNLLHDFIALEYWKNSGKKGINYKYINIDKARISGVELSLSKMFNDIFDPDNSIHYKATLVYTRGDKLTDTPGWFSTGVPLRSIPPFNTYHECTFRRLCSSAISLYLSGNIRYYATQNRIAPTEDGGYVSPSYCLFGAAAGMRYNHRSTKWELKLKADNLTNNNYVPFETLISNMGRNFKAMLILNF